MNNRSTYFSLRMLVIAVLAISFTVGCSSTKPYAVGPVKTLDPDTTTIPKPEKKPQYQYWDRIDNSLFHQMEKPLDLNRTGRFVGQVLGVADARQADNINKLDEVPESSWYTKRHYYHPMTAKELARGPNTVQPDTSGQWTIFQAKLEGAGSGFFIKDQQGNRFLIKFDGYDYPELTTAAEVIGAKIFYAAGYTVPEATIVYFDPEKVTIGDSVTVEDNGNERLMTKADYRSIVKNRPTDESGKIRAMASKFVDGIPMGPWGFEGTRDDDPNDRVDHEHRRELRGMRVISSWLNDTDRRDANTMSVYTDKGYLAHYVQDFGNVLGANGSSAHKPIQGQAYLIDPRYMALSTVSLGTYVYPWEKIESEYTYPAVGYFRADVFRPEQWVPTHPLPAFENMTLRDAFWGTKIVMSFSDEDIRTIVETAQISNPKAESYLVQTLAKRRDKIGRHWFQRINPLDKFTANYENNTFTLDFVDLAIEGELVNQQAHRYLFDASIDGKNIFNNRTSDHSQLSFTLNHVTEEKQIVKFEIYTLREYADGKGKEVTVYIELKNHETRIVGIQREE